MRERWERGMDAARCILRAINAAGHRLLTEAAQKLGRLPKPLTPLEQRRRLWAARRAALSDFNWADPRNSSVAILRVGCTEAEICSFERRVRGGSAPALPMHRALTWVGRVREHQEWRDWIGAGRPAVFMQGQRFAAGERPTT